MARDGLDQQRLLCRGQEEVPTIKSRDQRRGTVPMAEVPVVVQTRAIVQEGKEGHHIRAGSRLPAQRQAPGPHPGPMADAMDAMPVELVPGTDEPE